MRKQQSGTVVTSFPTPGLIANAKAARVRRQQVRLTGLTQSINSRGARQGIRACAISPGDIDTPILEKRPRRPRPRPARKMLQPDDIADCVMLAVNLPSRAVVEQLVIRPR